MGPLRLPTLTKILLLFPNEGFSGTWDLDMAKYGVKDLVISSNTKLIVDFTLMQNPA